LCGPAKAACGLVTFYGTESGNRTANGEHFDGSSLTAAHRSLPFGTRLRVSYKGKSVVVRINDRGPAAWTGKDLDLSQAAFHKLAPLRQGVIKACWGRVK
jgi:rare lipoprotein A